MTEAGKDLAPLEESKMEAVQQHVTEERVKMDFKAEFLRTASESEDVGACRKQVGPVGKLEMRKR